MASNPPEIGTDYKVGYGKPPVHSRFQPGQVTNPGGKPTKSKNRLQGAFLRDLADHFDQHGKKAIARCCEDDPSAYIRAIVALMPKELQITREFEDLTDEQLSAAVAAARSLAAAIGIDPGAGDRIPQEHEQAQVLPALSETG